MFAPNPKLDHSGSFDIYGNYHYTTSNGPSVIYAPSLMTMEHIMACVAEAASTKFTDYPLMGKRGESYRSTKAYSFGKDFYETATSIAAKGCKPPFLKKKKEPKKPRLPVPASKLRPPETVLNLEELKVKKEDEQQV